MRLEPGLKGFAETVVVHENTAAAVGSGAQEVFATPSMIALMEKAALKSVMPYLAEGESTVRGLRHLDRGYEELETTLGSLGAEIRRQDGGDEGEQSDG